MHYHLQNQEMGFVPNFLNRFEESRPFLDLILCTRLVRPMFCNVLGTPCMYIQHTYIHTTTETRFPRTKVLQSGHTRTNWRRRSSVTQGAGSDQCVSIKYLRRRVSSILLGLGGCRAPVLPIVVPSRPQLYYRCLHCQLK